MILGAVAAGLSVLFVLALHLAHGTPLSEAAGLLLLGTLDTIFIVLLPSVLGTFLGIWVGWWFTDEPSAGARALRGFCYAAGCFSLNFAVVAFLALDLAIIQAFVMSLGILASGLLLEWRLSRKAELENPAPGPGSA